jgi:hypothetical protein
MTMQDFRRMAAEMDQRARQLMSENVTGRELIHRMVGHMPDLQKNLGHCKRSAARHIVPGLPRVLPVREPHGRGR